MLYVQNFSTHASQAWESSKATLDRSASFIGQGVEQVISQIDLKFNETEVGQKLERVWSWVKSGEITDKDATQSKVKKAAFALFVSLPALFFIKDIIKTTSADQMSKVETLSECFSVLIKTAVYTSVILTALDFALSMVPKEKAPAATAAES